MDLVALYVAVTVGSGCRRRDVATLAGGGARRRRGAPLPWRVAAAARASTSVYVFLPQLATLLVRLAGAGRCSTGWSGALVIGDCPWSRSAPRPSLKLFACSYSAAGLHVYSGNPADHLVHRSRTASCAARCSRSAAPTAG